MFKVNIKQSKIFYILIQLAKADSFQKNMQNFEAAWVLSKKGAPR
jgi:hypothetical protein